jgi:hypothetical protein
MVDVVAQESYQYTRRAVDVRQVIQHTENADTYIAVRFVLWHYLQ